MAADQAEELIRRGAERANGGSRLCRSISAKRGDRALALLQTAIDRQLMDDAAARNQLIRLYAWQGLPYRGARLLESAMAKGQMKQSAEIANCWPSWEGAREWPKAVDSWQLLIT